MFKNINLGIKIGGGFIVVLFLMAVVAYIGYNGMSGVADRAAILSDMNKLTKYMLETRVQVKDFIRLKKDETALQVEENIKKLTAQAEATKSKLEDQADKDRGVEFIKKVENYHSLFLKFKETNAKRENAIVAARNNATSVMEKTEAIASSQDGRNMSQSAQKVIQKLLQLRVDFLYYLYTNGSKTWADEFEKMVPQIQNFISNMAEQSERNKTVLNELNDNVKTYRNSFLEVVSLMEELAKDETQMATAAEEAVSLCEDFNNVINNAMDTEIVSADRMLILGFLCAIIIGALAAYFITRSITVPISEGVDAANRLAEGDLTVEINVLSKDEIGRLMGSMKNMVDSLKTVVSDVVAASTNVASGSQQLSSTAEQLSQGATEQAASAEEASTSMEQMSANIKQSSENAQQTEGISVQAAKDAERGGKAVSETVEAMKSIADKIGIIEEIARQTNMLALNAAIEAARAGEHGKGFAVVADAVRKLAEKSQAAAGEISRLSISSVEIAENAGSMFNKIIPDIRKTSELIQEISIASKEQNEGVGQINQALIQLDQVIQQNASASEEMSSTSEELAVQAERLKETIAFFKLGNNGRNGKGKVIVPYSLKNNQNTLSDSKMITCGKNKVIPEKTHHDTKHNGIVLEMSDSENGTDVFDKEFIR